MLTSFACLLITQGPLLCGCVTPQDHTLDGLGPRYAVAFDEYGIASNRSYFLNHVRLHQHQAATGIHLVCVLSWLAICRRLCICQDLTTFFGVPSTSFNIVLP